jgi:glycerophosphoryl diester phosphodiesterase
MRAASGISMAALLLAGAALLMQGAGEARHVVAISHRGEHLHHPENTIPAFEEAIRVGADYIEADIQTTSDGMLVLSHDGAVDRCTNGSGQIRNMSFEQVEALDAGIKAGPQFAGTKIPTFDQVLELAHGHIGVYVDVKNASAAAIAQALEKHDMVEHSVIYRGGIPLLEEMQRINPKLNVMPESRSTDQVKQDIERLHPRVIAFGAGDFTPEIIGLAKQADAKVYVDRMGNTDQPEGWQAAIDAGADGIQTDRPGPLVEYLREKGYGEKGYARR